MDENEVLGKLSLTCTLDKGRCGKQLEIQAWCSRER